MSEAFYNIGGLRFWNEREILIREQAAIRLHQAISKALLDINSAWRFERVEGTILTPAAYINTAYDDSDVWELKKDGYSLRPETTASSYLYAEHLLRTGKARVPLCVWQHGKSFRVESNDGARASELRFNEFYQCEFQCIYRADSKADYSLIISDVEREISKIIGKETRIIPSDRLPDYSEKTTDIEAFYNNKWKEVCSVSIRKDFSLDNMKVLEIAVGTDRLISIEPQPLAIKEKI